MQGVTAYLRSENEDRISLKDHDANEAVGQETSYKGTEHAHNLKGRSHETLPPEFLPVEPFIYWIMVCI